MAVRAPAATKPVTTEPALGQRRRWLPLAVGGLLIVVCAIVQGVWSDRWSDPNADARVLATKIDQIPLTLGDWDGEDLPTTERELRASGAVGHLSRVYRNRVTGQQVSLFVICGHMRNVSVHTPDRCYPAAGFDQLAEPVHFSIPTPVGTLDCYTTTFRQEEAAGIQQQRVFWTWGQDNQWQAPDNPRVTYHGLRALYKLYLISSVPPGIQQPPTESPCLAFAQEEMAKINGILFAPAAAE